MRERSFGKTKTGEETTLYIFENKNGMTMEVTDLGATLYALRVPDKDGKMVDVVLGYDDAVGYQEGNGTFFGATVGRNGNRIGKASFSLNGITYHLDKNNNGNNLHSGLDYYSFRLWKVKEIHENSIVFALHSPDGDQGYPGAVDVEVKYVLSDENEVQIEYLAVPQADTILNMTNHSYFNLEGHDSGDVLKQIIWMDADFFVETDVELIPTGRLLSVENTPMDFRNAKTIGRDIKDAYEPLLLAKGYDHNWCLNNNGTLTKVASLASAKSGITMEVYTDLPGVQVYTANFVENEKGKAGAVYQKHHGVCFETQYYPDAINQECFTSPVCKSGEAYKTTTIYKFI